MFERLFLCCVCSLLLAQPIVNASSALAVMEEMRNTALVAQEEAQTIAEKDRLEAEVAEAKAEVARDEAELAKAEAEKTITVQEAAAAQEVVRKAEEAAKKAEAEAAAKKKAAEIAEANEAAAKAEVLAAQAALNQAKLAEAQAEQAESAESQAAEAEAKAQAAAAAAAALNAAGDNETKMDQAIAVAEAASDRAYALANARVMAAAGRSGEAAAAVEAAEQRLSTAEEKVESSADAHAEAADAISLAADARKDFLDAKTDADELQKALVEADEAVKAAKTDLKDSKAALADTQKQLEPIMQRRSFQTESQYYSWKDSQGNSGYQFYQPIEYNYMYKDTEYGLRTGYAISDNKASTNGRVSTWTDTVLSLAKINQKNKYSIRYSLDVNLPTGKSSLAGTGAIMSDDLVELSRFGEGWNYTPGISISWKNGKEDTWTLATSYALRGDYTYNSSIADGRIHPGNEWGKSLRWLHAGQKWQMSAELAHTSFGVTKEGAVDYQEGSQLDAKLNYVRNIAPDQKLMLYYWYSTQKPYSSSDPVSAGIDGSGTVNRHYFGTEWSKALPNDRTLRLMIATMYSSGSTYNPLTDLTVNGRRKYSGIIGYDIALAPEKRVSFDLERFYMKDDSAASYHGYNLYFRYVSDI